MAKRRIDPGEGMVALRSWRDAVERGEEPACVAGCPCDVLKLVDSDVSDSAGMEKEMPGFKHFFTKPNIRFYPRMKRNEFIH